MTNGKSSHPMRLLSFLLSLAALSTGLAATPAYTAKPLPARSGPPAGGKLFTQLAPADAGVEVPNLFEDPRMWGNRFRELTLGAVETGIAVADFDHDGWMDIYAVSKNGPCAGPSRRPRSWAGSAPSPSRRGFMAGPSELLPTSRMSWSD